MWVSIFIFCEEAELENRVAGVGFEPTTFGLWAQRAATAPSRDPFIIFYNLTPIPSLDKKQAHISKKTPKRDFGGLLGLSAPDLHTPYSKSKNPKKIKKHFFHPYPTLVSPLPLVYSFIFGCNYLYIKINPPLLDEG